TCLHMRRRQPYDICYRVAFLIYRSTQRCDFHQIVAV
ncbi:hypothetical protein LSPCS325_54210, partial [Lysinibacillus sp. CTST325]